MEMKTKNSYVIIFIVSFLFSQEEIIHISKTHRDGTPKEVIIYEIVNDDLQSNNPFSIVEKISYDSKGNYVKPKISKNRGRVDLSTKEAAAETIIKALKRGDKMTFLKCVSPRVLNELKDEGDDIDKWVKIWIEDIQHYYFKEKLTLEDFVNEVRIRKIDSKWMLDEH
jgi:hypothetical protein